MDKLDPAATGLSHLSFSAVRDYLTNPRAFRKKWLERDFSRKPGVALIKGAAYHAALEVYWKRIMDGKPLDVDAMERALNDSIDLNYPETAERLTARIAAGEVADYEKMGCVVEEEVRVSASGRKTTVRTATLTARAIHAAVWPDVLTYITQRGADTFEPVAVEDAFVVQTKNVETGEPHPFPLKIKPDMLAWYKADGRKMLVLVDHKYSSVQAEEADDGAYLAKPAQVLQGSCYESGSAAMLAQLGLAGHRVEAVIFDLFNPKNGTMTMVMLPITDFERVIWSRVYAAVCFKIMLAFQYEDYDKAFLPNPDDLMNDDGWKEYEQDVRYSLENAGAARPPAPAVEGVVEEL